MTLKFYRVSACTVNPSRRATVGPGQSTVRARVLGSAPAVRRESGSETVRRAGRTCRRRRAVRGAAARPADSTGFEPVARHGRCHDGFGEVAAVAGLSFVVGFDQDGAGEAERGVGERRPTTPPPSAGATAALTCRWLNFASGHGRANTRRVVSAQLPPRTPGQVCDQRFLTSSACSRPVCPGHGREGSRPAGMRPSPRTRVRRGLSPLFGRARAGQSPRPLCRDLRALRS
jgi:hypothetical protein